MYPYSCQILIFEDNPLKIKFSLLINHCRCENSLLSYILSNFICCYDNFIYESPMKEELPPSNKDQVFDGSPTSEKEHNPVELPRWHLSLCKFPVSVFFYLTYLSAVALAFTYGMVYHKMFIPNSIQISLADTSDIFIYNKEPFDNAIYLSELKPVIFLTVFILAQWIISAVANWIITDQPRREHIIEISDVITSFLVFQITYRALCNNAYAGIFLMSAFLIVIYTICRLSWMFWSKMITIILLFLTIALRYLPGAMTYTPLETYLIQNNFDLQKYKSFLGEYEHTLNDVFVFSSTRFVEAYSIGYDNVAIIWICQNLLKSENFNVFKATVLHEIGHCRMRHIMMAYAVSAPISIIGAIYFALYLKKNSGRSLRQYMSCCFVLFTISELFKLGGNSYFQKNEFKADRFVVDKDSKLNEHLALGLLMNNVKGKRDGKWNIEAKYFINAPYNPLYTHPGAYERVKRLIEKDNIEMR